MLAAILPVVAVNALGNPAPPTVLDGLGGVGLRRDHGYVFPFLLSLSRPSKGLESVVPKTVMFAPKTGKNEDKNARLAHRHTGLAALERILNRIREFPPALVAGWLSLCAMCSTHVI